MPSPTPSFSYLTTREVADLLRVKERKVYDLASADEIPHRRITGKLLFPADEIYRWIEGDPSPSPARPDIIAGSHDPLLDWAAREADTGLATLFDGSAAGLARFAAGDAALSGLHIPEGDDWNLDTVAAEDLSNCVLIGMAYRTQGLILRNRLQGEIHSLEDLNGMRVILRQTGSGARTLFDQLSAQTDLKGADLDIPPARTETDAAQAVASDEADIAFGLEAAARQFGLAFLPMAQERFDLLIDRRAYFLPPVQHLLAFLGSTRAADKARSLGGYDLSVLGTVRWVSP